MRYMINQKQLTCINILIRTMQEVIDRDLLSEEEKERIFKTVKILTEN